MHVVIHKVTLSAAAFTSSSATVSSYRVQVIAMQQQQQSSSSSSKGCVRPTSTALPVVLSSRPTLASTFEIDTAPLAAKGTTNVTLSYCTKTAAAGRTDGRADSLATSGILFKTKDDDVDDGALPTTTTAAADSETDKRRPPPCIDSVEVKVTFDAGARPSDVPESESSHTSDGVLLLEDGARALFLPSSSASSPSLPTARIVIHRVENLRTRSSPSSSSVAKDLDPFRLSSSGSDAGPDDSAPRPSAAKSRTDIYPLLNEQYDEVGSVEVLIDWPSSSTFVVSAGGESETMDQSSSSSPSGPPHSYTLDDYHFQDPMALLRKSWSANKSWLNGLTAASASGQLLMLEDPSDPSFLRATSRTDRLPPPPPTTTAPSRSKASYSYAGSKTDVNSYPVPPSRLSFPASVVFDVDISRPRTKKNDGDGASSSSHDTSTTTTRAPPRVVERRFLARREAEWERLRKEKEMKLAKIREQRKDVTAGSKLVLGGPSKEERRKVEADEKATKDRRSKAAMSERIMGRVERRNNKARAPPKAATATTTGGKSKQLFFRPTLLGVYAIVDKVRTKPEAKVTQTKTADKKKAEPASKGPAADADLHAAAGRETTAKNAEKTSRRAPSAGPHKTTTTTTPRTESSAKRLEAASGRLRALREAEASQAAEVERRLGDSKKQKAREEKRSQVLSERVNKAKRCTTAAVAVSAKKNKILLQREEDEARLLLLASNGNGNGTPRRRRGVSQALTPSTPATPGTALGVGPPIGTPRKQPEEGRGDNAEADNNMVGRIPTPVTGVKVVGRRGQQMTPETRDDDNDDDDAGGGGSRQKEMAVSAAINMAGYAWRINPKQGLDGTPELTLTPVGKIVPKWGGGVKTALDKEWKEKPKGVGCDKNSTSTKKVVRFGKETTPPSSKGGAVKVKVRTTPAKTPKDGSKKAGRKLVIVLTDGDKEKETALKTKNNHDDHIASSLDGGAASPPVILQSDDGASAADKDKVANAAAAAVGGSDKVNLGGYFEGADDEKEGGGDITAFAMSDDDEK